MELDVSCLLQWIIVFVCQEISALTTTEPTPTCQTSSVHSKFHPPHIWSPPRVDPLLCETLQSCNDSSSSVQYVKQLCEHPRGVPSNGSSVPSDSTPSGSRLKRTPVELPKSKLKIQEQFKMLELHNDYRKKTIPTAGDMLFMKWDDYLADVAQMWAENCVFDHGFPEELDIEGMGQNLYIGYDPTGIRAMTLWWEEFQYFNYDTLECDEEEQCGHYLQMSWADSESLGCGVAKCPKLGHYVVCHYRPQGVVPDIKPFTVGSPCSQCWSLTDGAHCYDGLCATKKDCEKYNLTCACNLTCHNCGRLSSYYCRCICKRGWDGTDCSRECNNLIDWCGEYPGWPDASHCHEEDFLVRNRYCRQMCTQCKLVDLELPEQERNESKEYCCTGTTCETGLVLDTTTCSCYPLCPGPACLQLVTTEPTDESNEEKSHEEKSHEEKSHEEKSNEEKSREEKSREEESHSTLLQLDEINDKTVKPDKEASVTNAPAVPVRSSSSHLRLSLWWLKLFLTSLSFLLASLLSST